MPHTDTEPLLGWCVGLCGGHHPPFPRPRLGAPDVQGDPIRHIHAPTLVGVRGLDTTQASRTCVVADALGGGEGRGEEAGLSRDSYLDQYWGEIRLGMQREAAP